MPPAQVQAREAARSPSPLPRAALARRSSLRATGPLPSPSFATVEKAMRARRARHPSSPVDRSFGALEVTCVVDARDDKPPVALFDHGDRGVLDSERKEAMVRASD